jgi:hypothetical protein
LKKIRSYYKSVASAIASYTRTWAERPAFADASVNLLFGTNSHPEKSRFNLCVEPHAPDE